MLERLRVGYVGCGFMAQKVHLPNLASLPECELLALAEVRPRLGEKVRARYRIPKLYRDHRELAADRTLQAVGVSAHYAVQSEIARELLLAGKDVFMEKPLAISLAQAERLLEAERVSGRRLMVAHMKRYDAGNLLFKRLLDQYRASGELGRLTYARNHGFGGDWVGGLETPLERTEEPYPQPTQEAYPEWLPKPARQGYLAYLQQWCHNLNLLRWLLDGSGKVQVKAVDLDRRDGCSGIVVLEINGVRATIESGQMSCHGWDEQTQVYFEKGWMRSEAPPLLLRYVPATVQVYRGGKGERCATEYFPDNIRSWSYLEELRHFLAQLRSGEPFRTSAGDTLEDVRVIEALYRAFIEGQAA